MSLTKWLIYKNLNQAIVLSNILRRFLRIRTKTLLVAYKGYGSPWRVFIKGSLLKDRPTLVVDRGDKRFKNMRNMIARYLSTPQAGLCVEVCVGEQQKAVMTDEKGYFEAWLEPNEALEPGWHTAHCRLKDGEEEVSTVATFLVVAPERVRFGVISDIDDTVLISHATRLFRKLWLILTKNARTRLPFEGVAHFYQQLEGQATAPNPLFYVSSSEWNLYDFLEDFFAVNDLPKGPFLLQQLKKGLRELIFTGGGDHSHKLQKINRLFDLYPDLPFVLIGDSGQHDISIYATVVARHPDSVLAVYIRQVRPSDEIDPEDQRVFDRAGVKVLLSPDTAVAEQHARSIGLIDPSFGAGQGGY